MALETRSLQAFSSAAPGEEGGLGGRALFWLVLAHVGSALSFSVRLLHPGTLLGFVWSVQVGIARVVPAITSVLYPRRRRLLMWIRSQVPACEVPDLAAMWRHGGLLCALVEASVSPDPRLGCRFEKYRGSAAPSMKLGQKLAAEYLRVPPEFSDSELESELTPAIMDRLVGYLSALEHAASRLRDGSQDHPEREPEFTARGMGLVMAVQGRRATFSLFPTQRRTLFTADTDSLLVQIQGPFNDRGSVLISARAVQAHHTSGGLRQIIPITVLMTLESARVTYTPRSPGHHQMSLLYRGHHVAGSPHLVSVEARDVRNDFINVPRSLKPSSKVLSRIVDFVTEKRILTDDGKLIEIEKQSGILTRQLSVKKRTGHIFARRKIIGKRKLLGFKTTEESEKSEEVTPKSEVQIIVHEPSEATKKANTGKAEFKDSCKRILWICDLLLKNSNKDKSLRMLNTAEQILSEGKEMISVRDQTPSPISEKALCRLRGHLHANSGGLNEVSVLREATPAKHVVLKEYSNTLRPDNIPLSFQSSEELMTESLPITVNMGEFPSVKVRRFSEPVEVSRNLCGFDEMDEIINNGFCTVKLNKSTNNLEIDEIITKENTILNTNENTINENVIKIEEETLINTQESSKVTLTEKESVEIKSLISCEHKTLHTSLVNENSPPITENPINTDNKISLNPPQVSNPIETNIDISNIPSTSSEPKSIVDMAINNYDAILASTNLEDALKYFDGGFRGKSEIMEDNIKVADWMGPAEKEIWTNELDWFQSDLYKSREDSEDDDVFAEDKSEMQIVDSGDAETDWQEDIEKVLSDTYLHKNSAVLEKETSLRRKRYKDTKEELEKKEVDSHLPSANLLVAVVDVTTPFFAPLQNEQRLLHCITEENTPISTPVNDPFSPIPYVLTTDQYLMDLPIIVSTHTLEQSSIKSDLENTELNKSKSSSETSYNTIFDKSLTSDIEDSKQFREQYKRLSYSKNINKTEEVEKRVEASDDFHNEVSPSDTKDMIALETELKQSKETSKDTSLCDSRSQNNKELEIDIISELRRDSETLAIIRNFTDSVEDSDINITDSTLETIENKGQLENNTPNKHVNIFDIIAVNAELPEKIENNIKIESNKDLINIDSNVVEDTKLIFIDGENNCENALIDCSSRVSEENVYENVSSDLNKVENIIDSTPLVDFSFTDTTLIDSTPEITFLTENINENALKNNTSLNTNINIIDSTKPATVDFIDIQKSTEININENAVEHNASSIINISSADVTPTEHTNAATTDLVSSGFSVLEKQASSTSSSSPDDSIIGVTRRLSATLHRCSQPHDSLSVPEYLQLLAHSPDIDSIGTPDRCLSALSNSPQSPAVEEVTSDQQFEPLNLNTLHLLDTENNILQSNNNISNITDTNLNKNIVDEIINIENTDEIKNYNEKSTEFVDKLDNNVNYEYVDNFVETADDNAGSTGLVEQDSSPDSLTMIINELQHERNLHHARLEELKLRRKKLGENFDLQDKFDFSTLTNKTSELENNERQSENNKSQDIIKSSNEGYSEITTPDFENREIEREDSNEESKLSEELSESSKDRRESLVAKRKNYWDEKVLSEEDPNYQPPLPSQPPPPIVEATPRYLQKEPSVQLSGIVARSLQCFEKPQTEKVHDAIFYARRVWATPTMTPEPEVSNQTPDLIASQNKVKYVPKKYDNAPEIIPQSFNNRPVKKLNPDSELEQYSINIGSRLSVFEANSSRAASPALPKSPIKTSFNQPDIISSKIHSKPIIDIDFDSKRRVSVSNIASKFNTQITTQNFPTIKPKPLNKKSLRGSQDEPITAVRKNSAPPLKTKEPYLNATQTREFDPASNKRGSSLSIERGIFSPEKDPISTDENRRTSQKDELSYKIDLVQSRMNPIINQSEISTRSLNQENKNDSFNKLDKNTKDFKRHSIIQKEFKSDKRKSSSSTLEKRKSLEPQDLKTCRDSSLDSKLPYKKYSLQEVKIPGTVLGQGPLTPTEPRGPTDLPTRRTSVLMTGQGPSTPTEARGPTDLPARRGSVLMTKELLDRKLSRKGVPEGGSPEEAPYHTVKYTTGEATVVIVPSRSRENSLDDDYEQDIKPKSRKSLMHQFSIEVSPSLTIETNFVNPLCDLNAHFSPTPASRPERVRSDGETKGRFETAKNFFKTLEGPRGEDSGAEATTKGGRGRFKDRRGSLAAAETSPTPVLKHANLRFASERQAKVIERFHVKDLFRQIEDKAVGARGIPNPLAVVAALNSAVHEGGAERAASPYDLTRPDEGAEGSELEEPEPEANGLQRRGSLEKRLTFKRLTEKSNAEMF